jgi:hypothetical protein
MEGIKQTTEISPTIITARMGENVTLRIGKTTMHMNSQKVDITDSLILGLDVWT